MSMVEDEAGTFSTDIEKVPCPYCGNDNCLIDALVDGWLKDGATFNCDSCGDEIELDVDWVPEIRCRKKSASPPAPVE